MNIAQFRQEFARRSAMTVYERVNEDAAAAKAAKAQAFQDAGGWWLDVAKWDYTDASSLSRPTETLAFRSLLWRRGHNIEMATWMRTLKAGWPSARAAVLARQAERDAERRERVRRLRLRRPVGVPMAFAL